MSRIGKRPVALPKGVTATVSGQTVQVKGPKGTRSFTATDDVDVKLEGESVRVAPRGSSKRARQQWGMTRTRVANLVTGVTEGFKKELEIHGVGYRAEAQGPNALRLNLGFSHSIDVKAPEGITFEVPAQTQVIVSGIDKEVVGQVAADIRSIRKPEPYKGKGVRYAGERVVRKAGKAGKN